MKSTEYSVKQFALVYVALIALALLTWGVAQVRLGAAWMNDVVAVAIAFTKATLVVTVFMNLKHSQKIAKLWAAAGVGWLLIMGTILGDYLTRPWDTLPKSWVKGETTQVAGGPNGGAPTPNLYQGKQQP